MSDSDTTFGRTQLIGHLLFSAFFIIATLLLSSCSTPERLTPASGSAGETIAGPGARATLLVEHGPTFSPALREAWLALEASSVRAELAAEGVEIPEALWAWIDADPLVKASVYGAHRRPADVVRWLVSLRIDLGPERFEKYPNLVLAAAILSAKQELVADLSPREPLVLRIGGDPRVPVDTKDPDRELDMNDHIINFLNDHSLHASDIFASREWQEKFNAYMKAQGYEVDIDCGDGIIHWNARNMPPGEMRGKILKAHGLFREAYEAKGLLPAARDPFPMPAERCAYLIRNHEYVFSDDLQAQRKWPRFPLNAPWPVLMMLVADDQPLREREERWEAFRDEGEFRTWGEYVGTIAQKYHILSARRLRPYPFTYGTIQMMLKDGGVCGAMADISARSHNTLGIPACTAGQPGHCAMVNYRFDPESSTYSCVGGQYVTGGDDKTTPHTRWYFGDASQRRGMIYDQSIAWGVNLGMSRFLDAQLVYAIHQSLPDTVPAATRLSLLESGIALNPYSFLLVEAAQDIVEQPAQQIDLWKKLEQWLAEAGEQPGCPADGLYNQTVKSRMIVRLSGLPVPESPAAEIVLDFLEADGCNNAKVLTAYRVAVNGLDTVKAQTEAEAANGQGVP